MTELKSGQEGDVELVEAILAQLSHSQDVIRRTSDDSAIDPTDAATIAARRQIRTIARGLQASSSHDLAGSSDEIIAQLSALTRLCDQKFVAFSYDSIPAIWRAIYIDAQLVKACCALKAGGNSGQDAQLSRCIRDLDMALIVAGAASTSKGPDCHDLIASLQSRLLDAGRQGEDNKSLQYAHHSSPPRKRPKLEKLHHRKPQLSEHIQADSFIPQYSFEEAPSFMDLAGPDSSTRATPFIVRAYAQGSGWSAVQSGVDDSPSGSWSSSEHLLRAAGPARVVPVEVGANYARKDWGQDVMLWSDFLRYCRWDEADQLGDDDVEGPGSTRPVLYMAQHDLAAQIPALERDYMLPDYVFTSPPPPESWPGYKSPSTPDEVITNLWIGPAGTVSPPHHDPFYNCFVQAVGYKEVWVAPPHCCPRKMPTASDPTSKEEPFNPASEQTSDRSGRDTKEFITDSLMANTANIDVFDTIEDVPPLVRAAAAKAILGPGDLLYMPPGWWHSLRSLTRSFSVSVWF